MKNARRPKNRPTKRPFVHAGSGAAHFIDAQDREIGRLKRELAELRANVAEGLYKTTEPR